jgi:hypothetical protein
MARREAQAALKGAVDWKRVLQIGVDKPTGLAARAFSVLMRRDDVWARRFDRRWQMPLLQGLGLQLKDIFICASIHMDVSSI